MSLGGIGCGRLVLVGPAVSYAEVTLLPGSRQYNRNVNVDACALSVTHVRLCALAHQGGVSKISISCRSKSIFRITTSGRNPNKYFVFFLLIKLRRKVVLHFKVINKLLYDFSGNVFSLFW